MKGFSECIDGSKRRPKRKVVVFVAKRDEIQDISSFCFWSPTSDTQERGFRVSSIQHM